MSNGDLKNEDRIIASGATIKTSTGSTSTYVSGKGYVYTYTKSAPEYIFGKMGYSLLTGVPLAYAIDATRLDLLPSGSKQYAYKDL